MSCRGPCLQGRRPCPTPEQCAQDDDTPRWWVQLAIWLAIYLAVVIAGTLAA